ncbi:N-acetylmuramoyl-L-alanine amidase [Nocardioides lijunqiniae]|uniref:N-acetylmuramoyl-L-alanine amidase n=1 Tax=Nocardioides lijunqiniae TaxID=2760832 RepID=UPI001878E4FD|nr:N-acetylmuramoyl-L-alanine amidase [Nocardioides lijunqiniae]
MATITQRVVRNARRRGLTVLTRPQWGSRYGSVYVWRRLFKRAHQPADTVVQHITVTFDSGKLVGDFKTDMRTIERIGYERFKSGFSYNFAVDMRDGTIGVGQPLDAKGTHTVNDKNVRGFSRDQNLRARAIAVIGMPGDQLSKDAEAAIVQLLAAMVDEGAVTPGFDYEPHSKFAYKDCPCGPTRDRMPAIRAAVNKAVRRPKR